MKERYFKASAGVFFLAVIFSLSSIAATKEWVVISGSSPQPAKSELVSENDGSVTILFSVPGFYKTGVLTPRGEASIISLPNTSKVLEAGAPDVTKLAVSVIIPDHASMRTEVVSYAFTDFQNIDIAPSKGNLKRDINPSEVPYPYGSSYIENEFYPGKLTDLRKPYILRDFRGQTVLTYPFQYNPVTRTLRVYTNMVVKITPDGVSAENVFNRTKAIDHTDATFSNMYRTQFINSTATYTPLPDHGNMLVICYTTFIPDMQPFVDWKNKMGQHTEMVDVATIGNAAAIKAYVANYYNTHGLTFLLLVGDGAQVPVFSTSNGVSDPAYGYITGNDSYAEVLVGRFSAQTNDQVQTQVQRTLTYEMNPDAAGTWYHKGVCIGSDQGPGDDNEMDYEHERVIRNKEMVYNYTDVDELYDGTENGVDASGDPNPSDLVASLNDGRSIVTYTGHGSTTSFGTTSFTNSNVPSLTNENMLPFIWSVACVNGDFNNSTCLAETFMRAKAPNGNPTGAIATYMSTINQSWDPPMDGQDEMVDLLVEAYPTNVKHTFGGISVNGCMHMNDVYGAAGAEMTDTWTCFGDPSLTLRTATPQTMMVTHPAFVPGGTLTLNVACTTDGAIICLSWHNQIIATGIANAGSVTLTFTGLTSGDTLDVVGTAYNRIPYFGTVIVTSPTGIQSISKNSFDLSYYPNPAGVNTTIQFNLITSEKVNLVLYNSIGQKVADLVTGEVMAPGNHQLNQDFSKFEKGIYYLELRSGGVEATRKIMVQ